MYYNQQNNNSIKKIRTKNTPGFLVFVNIASKYQPKIAGRPSAWRPSNNNGLANRFKNLNNNSIGIELENKGHQYGYQDFPSKQIKQLIKILKILKKKFKIQNTNIIGHSDIAPSRKTDPGEKFPWKKLYKNDLAIWHSLDEKFINNFRLKKLININKKNMLKMIKKLGYSRVLTAGQLDKDFTKAFQRRYRQQLINGIFDQECYLILNNLQKFI